MSTIKEVEASVLRLPEKHRRRIADKLLASLPPPPGAWSRDMIVEEARRRDNEIETGQVKPLTEEQFWVGVRPRHR
jgi:hypothetical protein